MRGSKFSQSLIVKIVREAQRGVSLEELLRQHGFRKATYSKWRAQYGGMNVSAFKRLKKLKEERPDPRY